jgi:hypothetical protein
MNMAFRTLIFIGGLVGLAAGPLAGQPLRVHPLNRLYFMNRSGEPVYLAGHQIFVDLQDNSFNKAFIRDKQRILDWEQYLDFIKAHHFNYVRNWVIWSTGSGSMAPVNKAVAFPMPYRRVDGHGKANDGGGKFDLYQFDETFFRRLRSRCEDLQQCGVYVSIMLFEVYGFLGGEACGNPKQTLWDGNVFNRANNVNDIHTDDNEDGKGIEFFYTRDRRALALQKQYVSKVIDTVGDLDNVLYEIANELYAPQWQHDMIEFIKSRERSRPKQHLVLMSPGGRTSTGGWKQMSPELVTAGPADCFAVAGSWNARAYARKNPPVNHAGRPGIVDMDHVSAGSDDVGYLWSAFTRGYHFNLYDKPFENPDAEGPAWERIRRNISQTITYAKRLDLSRVRPRSDLATTGFCLARPGEQYVIYQPQNKPFDVSALVARADYLYEWYDCDKNRVLERNRFTCSRETKGFSPLKNKMVLFLERYAPYRTLSLRTHHSVAEDLHTMGTNKNANNL